MAGYTGHETSDPLVELTSLAAADDVAVASNHGGELAGPPSPLVGELWADPGADKRIKKRNADDDGWDDIAPFGVDVNRSLVTYGIWTPGVPVSIGYTPRLVIATVALLHSDDGETDTETLLFSSPAAPDTIVVKTLQANDGVLGTTTAAVPGNPYLNRPVFRCVFRPTGFLITRTLPLDVPESLSFVAMGRS